MMIFDLTFILFVVICFLIATLVCVTHLAVWRDREVRRLREQILILARVRHREDSTMKASHRLLQLMDENRRH